MEMVSLNYSFPWVLCYSTSGTEQPAGKAQSAQPGRDMASPGTDVPLPPEAASPEAERELKTDREVAGASLGQLMDALSAAILQDACISGDHVLMALAEAAVLERELSNKHPRRWRVQQALDVLLQMGPHVTAALAAVLEHPLARAQISCIFSD
jgi:hypothetical protein